MKKETKCVTCASKEFLFAGAAFSTAALSGTLEEAVETGRSVAYAGLVSCLTSFGGGAATDTRDCPLGSVFASRSGVSPTSNPVDN